MGRAGYEGVQIASDGSVWLVADTGGKGGDKTKNAKQPNSFVYRFVPADKADLAKGGKLQALQVLDAAASRSSSTRASATPTSWPTPRSNSTPTARA